jgi:hypothetical protein
VTSDGAVREFVRQERLAGGAHWDAWSPSHHPTMSQGKPRFEMQELDSIDESTAEMHTGGMEDQRRKELLQRRQELLNKQTGSEGTETRRQEAEDRVTMAAAALRTPGFPKPLPAEVEAAERDLRVATEECDRINAELRDIDEELEAL